MSTEATQQTDLQNQNEDNSKDTKKFEAALKKLTAVLGGESLYAPIKVGGTDLAEAVAQLAKEEKDQLITEFKVKASALIKKKRDFDRFVVQQRQEMEKKVREQQKQFTEEANKLFGLMDNIQNIEREYYSTLQNAENGTENSETA